MAQRRRRKYGYKFTEKTQSKKGIAAFILAVLSIAIFIYVIVNSFHHGGNGSMYLGSVPELLSVLSMTLCWMLKTTSGRCL